MYFNYPNDLQFLIRSNDTRCVLWDSYAQQLSHYENVSLEDKIVIILQFAKVENFAGTKFYLSVKD